MIFTSDQRIAAFVSGNFCLDTDTEDAQGLVSWWPLGVHGGKSKDWDYSLDGTKHGTRVNGPTRKAVKHPRWGGVGVLEFDGAATYVSLPSGNYLDNPTKYSISASFRMKSLGSFSAIALFDFNTGFQDPSGLVSDGGRIHFQHDDTTNSQGMNSLLNTDQWYDAVGVWDGTDRRIFIDGSDASGTRNSGGWNVVGNTIGLGFGAEEFDGFIHNVRLYDKILSPALINDIHNEPWRIVYPLGVRSIFLPTVAAGGTEEFSTRHYPRGAMRGEMRGVV